VREISDSPIRSSSLARPFTSTGHRKTDTSQNSAASSGAYSKIRLKMLKNRTPRAITISAHRPRTTEDPVELTGSLPQHFPGFPDAVPLKRAQFRALLRGKNPAGIVGVAPVAPSSIEAPRDSFCKLVVDQRRLRSKTARVLHASAGCSQSSRKSFVLQTTTLSKRSAAPAPPARTKSRDAPDQLHSKPKPALGADVVEKPTKRSTVFNLLRH